MGLLGIDIGTTHTKVGLFDLEGRLIKMAVRPTESYFDTTGHVYLNADRLWETTITCIKEVVEKQDENVSVIGIASMAETGLLIERSTGLARMDLIPWYSRCAETEAELIASSDDPYERFKKSGLHTSFKYGLAKLLWVKRQDPHLLQNAVWLSTADFIAFKLTGKMGTDYTLAARTFAFRLDEKRWDEEWIHSFGLLDSLFPPAFPSGTCLGSVTREVGQHLGLVEGTPVSISGHDHVCAALAVGATRPGVVFDSMGTAETLFGTLDERPLTREDFNSGLSFGSHVLKNHYFWLGGVQSSGGSLEWLRNLLGDSQLTYEEIHRLLALIKNEPTGILYFPYLTGSGAPKPNPRARAAFIGLTASHGKGDLLKAVLEGTAYEIEAIRQTAEENALTPITKMIVVGGGTKNPTWLQVKADITNCELIVPKESQATLLGAALVAGIGCGLLKDRETFIDQDQKRDTTCVLPNAHHHLIYKKLFEEGYLFLQNRLREFYDKQL